MSKAQKSVIGNENIKVVFSFARMFVKSGLIYVKLRSKWSARIPRVLSNTVLQWKCFVRLWHHWQAACKQEGAAHFLHWLLLF